MVSPEAALKPKSPGGQVSAPSCLAAPQAGLLCSDDSTLVLVSMTLLLLQVENHTILPWLPSKITSKH